jgi:hypothetical protein
MEIAQRKVGWCSARGYRNNSSSQDGQRNDESEGFMINVIMQKKNQKEEANTRQFIHPEFVSSATPPGPAWSGTARR